MDNIKLKNELKEERRKIKKLSREIEKNKSTCNSLTNIFTKTQIRKLEHPQKVIRWSVEDIASSISLYSAGAKAYRLLKKRQHPLPAISTLKVWASKIELKPGILGTVLRLLSSLNYDKNEKLCVLSFDEMKIKSSYEYDKKNDKILEPSNYVQVAMIRGLCKNWKQVIYYNYDTAISADSIKEIILRLKKIGFVVVAMVCDLGPKNLKAWKDLEISVQKTYFSVPENHKIFVFGKGFSVNNNVINAAPVAELVNLQ